MEWSWAETRTKIITENTKSLLQPKLIPYETFKADEHNLATEYHH
jgi:hypothetical protein